MALGTLVCPRCFAPVAADARYCPRCGLRAALANPAADAAPLDVAVNGRVYRLLDRVGVGSRAVVYRCLFEAAAGPRVPAEGTFKVARDPVSNGALAREAEALRHLHAVDPGGPFTPYLPTIVESFGYFAADGDPPRHANVLRLDPAIGSPADDLYTLADVRAARPAGLDARDVAWIWRRLLTVLGFAHQHGVVHGAVLPGHVLIDPADHKLVLIGWCSATLPGRPPVPPAVEAAYRSWVDVGPHHGGATDVVLAARCMSDLLTHRDGTPDGPPVDPAITRHLDRCAHTVAPNTHPWQVRAEFDQLIDALWGPRVFRPLTLPPKRHSV